MLIRDIIHWSHAEMPLKKVKMKIHSQAFLHSACVEVMCAVFVAKQLCNPSLFCFLTRNLFGRKRLRFDTKKRQVLAYKKLASSSSVRTLLHCCAYK